MMDATIMTGMREATCLTRAGQLHEAVAIIQRTLQGGLGPEPAADAPYAAAETMIEGRCRVLDDEMGTYPHEPQRRSSLGSAASPGHTEAGTGPTAASHERTASLHEQWKQWREQRHGYRGPTPWSEPIPDRTPDIVPEGGRFITGSYTNHAGTRSYKLYIPSGYHGQPLPLVVMLHGCTQNPDDFAAGTRMNVLAEEHQCFVAYPAQSPAANSSKCWNWFVAADQQRDRGEPSIIAGLTRQIRDSHRVDVRRIYVAGLSAGGAMALVLAMTYPELYAAVGIHSGLPYAVAQDLPSALTAMHRGEGASARWHTAGAPVTAIVFHGDRDTTVHPCNGDQVIAQCATSHARRGAPPEGFPAPRMSVERGQVPHGYAYTRTTYYDASGQPVVEHWLVHGAGHAWSGGSSRGSFSDPKGPDATQEMLRFFYDHPKVSVSVS
jgi:poly(hydroxyalkanoate) depolymerase family esterase